MSELPTPTADDSPTGVITGTNSLWTRLIAVEAAVTSLSTNNERTWDEIGKLRTAVHPMATSLTTLTMLTERAEDDRARLLATVEALGRQLVPVVERVASQEFHAEARTHADTQRHIENQHSLTRIESVLERTVTRISRVEIVYGFVGAAIVLAGFLASDFGRRLFHNLLPLVPPT